jgi:hypothetical protein
MKAWQIQHRRRQFPLSPPSRYRVTCLCSLTTKSSSAATTAYSSPLNLIGPITIETLANTSLTTTAFFAPNHSKTGITSKRTSLTNIRPTLQLDDKLNKPPIPHTGPGLRSKYPTASGCTTATFPSSTVKIVNSPPPCFDTFTSIGSSVGCPDDTAALSVQEHSPLVAISKGISPTSTNSTPQSYTDSNRWRRTFIPSIAPPNLSHVRATHATSRNRTSTSFQENPFNSSSSDSPTRYHRSTPTNTNASASSITVRSTTRYRAMYRDVHHRAEGDVTGLGAASVLMPM